MKRSLVVAALIGAACYAQDGSRPASTNVRGAEYPRVYPDGRVTFKVDTPTAQRVQVAPGSDANVGNNGTNGLGKQPYDMVKDSGGIWTVTTPPVVPGFHYYWLLIDGVPANDPNSDTFFGYNKPTSGIDIPEKGVDFDHWKNVPHGQVRIRWYYSKITDAVRGPTSIHRRITIPTCRRAIPYCT